VFQLLHEFVIERNPYAFHLALSNIFR
jgi:hypothetical protein